MKQGQRVKQVSKHSDKEQVWAGLSLSETSDSQQSPDFTVPGAKHKNHPVGGSYVDVSLMREIREEQLKAGKP